MAGDFNKPTIDDLYTAVFTLMRENMAEVAKMLDASTATNIPVGAKRWNATTKRFEKWSGSAWSELLAKDVDSFDMRVALADDVFLAAGVTAKGQGQLGSVPTSAVTNANGFVLSGTFFVPNAVAVTNWPTANVGGFLSVEATTDGTYIRQIFTDYNAAKWWVRVSSNAGVAWTAWKDINAYVHSHTLDSLSNVTITANAAGEILKWNGSAWINNTLAEAGIAASGHTHPSAGVEAATASTIVQRDALADINCRLLRPNYPNESSISGAMAFRIDNGSNNYLRFCDSPAAVRGWLGFGLYAAGNGYASHGGLIIQWGNFTTAGGTPYITFPVAFPSYCGAISITKLEANGDTYTANAYNLGVGGFNAYPSDGANYNYRWMAVGY